MIEAAIETALRTAVLGLRKRGRRFALVGGLAVSVRAEVRFTRDVDLAVVVRDDADAEALVRDLRSDGFRVVASVEHEERKRLSTVRLLLGGVKVDLLFASSGIEPEIVDRASEIDVLSLGPVPVARAEDLLAMKVLSMNDLRLQDRIDAQNIMKYCPEIDLYAVREQLERIAARGFHRNQDLRAKLQRLIDDVSGAARIG
jgi:hypothetical protein